MTIIKFSSENRQIFFKKIVNFPEKVVKCSSKDRQIFLRKSSDFYAKIGRFFYKNGLIFLKKSAYYPTKITKFSRKIFKFLYENRQTFLQRSFHRIILLKQKETSFFPTLPVETLPLIFEKLVTWWALIQNGNRTTEYYQSSKYMVEALNPPQILRPDFTNMTCSLQLAILELILNRRLQ